MNRQNVDFIFAHSYWGGFGTSLCITAKLCAEPNTNKNKETSEWHLETTDYVGQAGSIGHYRTLGWAELANTQCKVTL